MIKKYHLEELMYHVLSFKIPKSEFYARHSVNFFNSRTAIAGAIIGLLLVFLQFKEFELYWGAVFFL